MVDRSGDADRYAVDGEFAFLGRTYAEYAAFFDLGPDAIAGQRVLDCPAGPGSFVAGACARGASALGVDPAFAASPDTLVARQQAAVADVADQLPEKTNLFTWECYEDVDDRLSFLRRAGRTFAADLRANPGRYVAGRLPDLPFADDSFDLACSANLLFLYGDRLDREFHEAALAELARVAEEVRVFPLVGLDTEPSPHLDEVVDAMRARGYAVEQLGVPYEFQQGADEMLVVT